MSFSIQQKQVLAITPRITGTISLCGSASIIYDIVRDRKKKLQRPYYRFLLGMSIFDSIASFWDALSTLPVPAGSPGVWGASGSVGTCTAQGFFLQTSLGGISYNLLLATYYLLVGRYHMSDEDISKRYELYMHLSAIIPAIGTAIAGLPLSLYNNALLWCWISSYPLGCESGDGPSDPNSTCERGHHANVYRWAFFYGPLWCFIAIITIMMIILTRDVRKEELQFIELQKLRAEKTINDEFSEESGVTQLETIDENLSSEHRERFEENISVLHRERKARLERSKRMFRQALFYVGAFYMTWLFATINRLINLLGGPSTFPMLVLTVVFLPMQGFFNFLVYRHGPCVA